LPFRDLIALTTAHIAVERMTMTKLGGVGNIAEMTNPPQMQMRQMIPAITIAFFGEDVR
jgi:hypothetical protein